MTANTRIVRSFNHTNNGDINETNNNDNFDEILIIDDLNYQGFIYYLKYSYMNQNLIHHCEHLTSNIFMIKYNIDEQTKRNFLENQYLIEHFQVNINQI